MKTILAVGGIALSVLALVIIGSGVATVAANDAAPSPAKYTATITFTDYKGRSVEGIPYTLYIRQSDGSYRLLQGGKLPASGVIDFAGDVPSELININLTEFNYTVDRFTFRADQPHVELALKTVPTPGELAPDADLVGLFDGKPVKLSDFRGQVIFVDFWASWCGWCQEPMAHNNEIMKRRARDWEGKAAIIGLSTNDNLKEVQSHVKSKEWTHVRQLWDPTAATHKNGRGVAYATYAMPYVPSSVLIGKDGTILWRGYPGNVDPEELIERALAGRPILKSKEETD